MNSSSIRMDIPGLTKFVYGWHQDSKSNIKCSNFIQLWLPPFYNISQKLGGLHVLENSFNHDIRTTHTKIEIEKLKANLPLRASHNIRIYSNSDNFQINLDYEERFKDYKVELGTRLFYNDINDGSNRNGLFKSSKDSRSTKSISGI